MPLTMTQATKLAADHVNWFSEILKPLLRSWMEHGYKHGWDDGSEKAKPLQGVYVVREPDDDGVGHFTHAICTTEEKAHKAASWYGRTGIYVVYRELDKHISFGNKGESLCSD